LIFDLVLEDSIEMLHIRILRLTCTVLISMLKSFSQEHFKS
jgi:hypothetical protein